MRRNADDSLVQGWSIDAHEIIATAIHEAGGWVACDQGADIRIQRLGETEPERLLRGHDSLIHRLDLEPDSGRLASASIDGSVRVWDPESGEQLAIFEHPRTATAGRPPHLWDVAWSPDGGQLYSAGWARGVDGWDVRSGRRTTSLLTPGGGSTGLLMTADGQRLVSVSRDRRVAVWDLQSGGEITTLRLPRGAWSLEWSPRGADLLVGHRRGLLRFAATPPEPSVAAGF